MATLNCILHPHHVNMGKHYTSIHTLHQHIEDSYYGLDKRPSHHGVSVPRFDVREDEKGFYLDGEVPGLTNIDEIFTEAIDGLTLIIRGSIKTKEGAEGARIPEQYANEEESKKGGEVLKKEGEEAMIWKLRERRVGPFERSFTFPSHFKYGSIEIEIEASVFSIKLLKDPEADKIAANQLGIKSEI